MTEQSKGKILLVDDSRIIQAVGLKILIGKGFNVSLAGDGQEALKLFGNNRFDLIILDYHMPKLNGLQVINAVRNSPSGMSAYDIPILMLSGESDGTIINQLLEAGAGDYIYKVNLKKTPEIFLEKVFGLLNFQEELVKYRKMKLHHSLSPVVLHFYRFGKDFIKRYLASKEITETDLKELQKELDSIHHAMEEGEIIELICETPAKEDFFISHSINCSILTIYFCGFTLCWEWEKIRRVAMGAFLHDFGNLHGESMLLHNPTELTEEEFKNYREHIERGVEIATKAGIDDIALEFIRNHHERSNGSGYPAGRKEFEMSDIGMISGIIDTFDALTFSRGLNKKMMVKEAVRKMKSWEGQYSEKYLQKFEELTRQLELKHDHL